MSLAPRRRSTNTEWHVTQDPDGSYAAGPRGRPLASGLTSGEAARMVRRNMKPGDKAFLIQSDGYKTRL